jgi:hypothetical protein
MGSGSSRRHPKVHQLDMLGTGTWLNMLSRVAPNFGELAEYGPSVDSEKRALQNESVGFGICIIQSRSPDAETDNAILETKTWEADLLTSQV